MGGGGGLGLGLGRRKQGILWENCTQRIQKAVILLLVLVRWHFHWACVSCGPANFCHTHNNCFLFITQVLISLQKLEENANVTKDSFSLDIFNTKEMVNAIVLPNFIAMHLVFEGSNFAIFCGCTETHRNWSNGQKEGHFRVPLRPRTK